MTWRVGLTITAGAAVLIGAAGYAGAIYFIYLLESEECQWL